VHARAASVTPNISLALLESLTFLEMRYRQDEVQDARADSCGWILTHEAYKCWMNNQHGLLWIKGKPGSGKSTLMKRIYKEDVTQSDIRLAFFFHRRGVQLQQMSIGMLRTMLHQLISQSASARVMFRACYHEKKIFGRHGEDWNWQDAELRQVLKSALVVATKSHAVSIFIDALDEAGEISAESIVNYIYEVHEELQGSARQTRICFSCRHYPIFSRNIGFEVCMEKENENDISACVYRQLSAQIHEHKRRSWADDLKVLQSQIASSACGVFLWATLMVPRVAKEYNKGKSLVYVRKMLQRAPPDLASIYEHILTTIIDDEDRKDSLHLMQWICLAKRPLSLTELRYALALDDSAINEFQNSARDSKSFVEDDARMKQLITSLSGGLVEVKDHNHSNVVQFIHQSVNDSLLSGGVEWLGMECGVDFAGQGHHRLTRSCVNYLKLREVQEVKFLRSNYGQARIEALPFLEYAIKSWFLHAQEAESKGIAQNDLIQRFEWPNTGYFHHWVKIFRAIDQYHPRCPELSTTLLHTSAASNLQSIVQELLSNGSILEEKDTKGNTALHFAARFGFINVVRMLLDAKANLQAKNLRGNTSLERAASGGHISTMELLMEHGADVNCGAGGLPTALYSAALIGSYLATRLLLDKGADINAQGGGYGNALQAAAYMGREPVVKLLLDKGADINAQGGTYGNALQAAAAYMGREPVVKLLLDKGADINAQGGEYGNALQAAAYMGSEPVVKLLLDKGADINAQGGGYGNALQAAAIEFGSEHMFKLLLDKGADINTQGGRYGNALQAAAYRGSEPVVKLLLDKGADINTQGGRYGNALQAAAYRGSEPVVKLLLNKRADIHAQDKQGRCPLHLAIRGNHHELIDLVLVNIGTPDWKYQDVQGCSSVHFAASGGADRILQLILKSDVDVNLSDTYGWTPLHWACRNGSPETVQTLLKSGADPDRKDTKGWIPLDVAMFCQNDSLVSLFQDKTNQLDLMPLITESGKLRGYSCSSCYHVSYVLVRAHALANQIPQDDMWQSLYL
jgi:ankyrin repeat protein